MTEFDYGILDDTRHRPWPMRPRPWVMTQTWHDLLFAHWRLPVEMVQARVPALFSLDTFDGAAWVGVVPFHMSNVSPRFVPALPWVSSFPELNVRTYVTAGGKPGVFFFSLDAGSAMAVSAARTLLHLPYFTADMSVAAAGDVRYSSRRTHAGAPPAEFEASYEPRGEPRPAVTGTLEYFLTERYCLYAADHGGRPYRLEIHHRPWPLQPADARITRNTMAAAAGLTLPDEKPLLHFSKRLDMVCWLPYDHSLHRDVSQG